MPAPDALPPVVCAVSTRSGSGFGVFCSLRGAPCLLLPMHVLGRVEDARLALVELVDGSRRRVHLQPDVMLAHSPAPPEGRPPDANHMDYALIACGVPTGVPREAFRPLEASVETAEVVAGDEIFVGAGTRVCDEPATEAEADSHAPTEWRRGFVTVPPRDRAGVTVRYSARTVPGWSGAPVVARERRAVLDDDDPEPRRGAGRLLAVHRAGADGADGEGITACEIARDVLETVATAGVRKAAAAGDLSAAVAELARAERGSRGARCRAAAAAAAAVAEQPESATAAMARLIERGGFAPADHARSATAAAALERELARWVEAHPKSARLAAATCHALGALARAGIVARDGGAVGDACVLGVLETHLGVGAIQAKGEWAMRMRRREGAGGRAPSGLRFDVFS